MTGVERTVMFRMPGVRAGFLVGLGGSVGGKVFALPSGTFVIGRQEGCDLPLRDPGVSREHAKIVQEGEDHVITDSESRNGTLVNRLPVRRAVLQEGDEIVICGAVMRFTYDVDQQQIPAPSSSSLPPEFQDDTNPEQLRMPTQSMSGPGRRAQFATNPGMPAPTPSRPPQAPVREASNPRMQMPREASNPRMQMPQPPPHRAPSNPRLPLPPQPHREASNPRMQMPPSSSPELFGPSTQELVDAVQLDAQPARRGRGVVIVVGGIATALLACGGVAIFLLVAATREDAAPPPPPLVAVATPPPVETPPPAQTPPPAETPPPPVEAPDKPAETPPPAEADKPADKPAIADSKPADADKPVVADAKPAEEDAKPPLEAPPPRNTRRNTTTTARAERTERVKKADPPKEKEKEKAPASTPGEWFTARSGPETVRAPSAGTLQSIDAKAKAGKPFAVIDGTPLVATVSGDVRAIALAGDKVHAGQMLAIIAETRARGEAPRGKKLRAGAALELRRPDGDVLGGTVDEVLGRTVFVRVEGDVMSMRSR